MEILCKNKSIHIIKHNVLLKNQQTYKTYYYTCYKPAPPNLLSNVICGRLLSQSPLLHQITNSHMCVM